MVEYSQLSLFRKILNIVLLFEVEFDSCSATVGCRDMSPTNIAPGNARVDFRAKVPDKRPRFAWKSR